MSFTADEYILQLCIQLLVSQKITRHLAARSYTMRFPNGRHPSVNVIRRFDQPLRKKNVTMTTS
jgi:hypothetical protein